MDPVFTLFEQINGKHTLESFTPVVTQHTKWEEQYKTKIFPKSANRLAFIFLTTFSFSIYCHTNSFSSTLSAFIAMAMPVFVINFSIQNLIKSKWGNKILSFSKKFRQQKADYDSSSYHFKQSLSSTEFQISIFETLDKIDSKLKEVCKTSYLEHFYRHNIQKLYNGLENFFAQENYDSAFVNIQESMNWLIEIFSLMEEHDQVDVYRQKLIHFKEKAIEHALIEKEIELEASKPRYNLRAML